MSYCSEIQESVKKNKMMNAKWPFASICPLIEGAACRKIVCFPDLILYEQDYWGTGAKTQTA